MIVIYLFHTKHHSIIINHQRQPFTAINAKRKGHLPPSCETTQQTHEPTTHERTKRRAKSNLTSASHQWRRFQFRPFTSTTTTTTTTTKTTSSSPSTPSPTGLPTSTPSTSSPPTPTSHPPISLSRSPLNSPPLDPSTTSSPSPIRWLPLISSTARTR